MLPGWLDLPSVYIYVADIGVVEHHLVIFQELDPTVVPIDEMEKSVDRPRHRALGGYRLHVDRLAIAEVDAAMPTWCQAGQMLRGCKTEAIQPTGFQKTNKRKRSVLISKSLMALAD